LNTFPLGQYGVVGVELVEEGGVDEVEGVELVEEDGVDGAEGVDVVESTKVRHKLHHI
jgi:hypothetical protein